MTAVVGDLSFWLLTAALAVLVAGQSWRAIQRRSAINRALHEIRRPLQALALTVPEPHMHGSGAPAPAGQVSVGAVRQAIRAVGELDRELNGGHRHSEKRELVACRLLSDACVRRCGPRARLAGAEIKLRWAGPDALIQGDGTMIASALENLLLNAIEHGGPHITVNALTVAHRLRLEVIDTGRSRLADRRAGTSCRLPGRRDGRHGHGLKVARRVAEQHGGRLNLKIAERGSRATLILPVNVAGASRSTAVRAEW
ncbi:MAG: ATP-binding protein [Actinomycetota bacterium]|nr:ATP-binding protein [Actinomycetota bacterium]